MTHQLDWACRADPGRQTDMVGALIKASPEGMGRPEYIKIRDIQGDRDALSIAVARVNASAEGSSQWKHALLQVRMMQNPKLFVQLIGKHRLAFQAAAEKLPEAKLSGPSGKDCSQFKTPAC